MIRLADPADFPFVYALYFAPENNPFLLYEMMDLAAFQPIFAALCAGASLYIFEQADQPIGMFKLQQLAHRTHHIGLLGGVAISPSQAGRGAGEAMLREAIALARRKGIKRLELSTATHNHRAIRLYEKVGFEREGVLRGYTHLLSEGRFIDELLMSRLLN